MVGRLHDIGKLEIRAFILRSKHVSVCDFGWPSEASMGGVGGREMG